LLIPYIFFTKDLDHPSLFEARSNPEVQQAPAHEKYQAVRDDLLGKQAKGDKKVEGMAAVSVGTLGRKFGILVADLCIGQPNQMRRTWENPRNSPMSALRRDQTIPARDKILSARIY
tara:strand:+ start:1235 stop:1585 length:351 start_codon:yes stop_codon:yes gene_type:complete